MGEEKKKIISIKPSEYAESVFMLDGNPFRLKGRRYLLPIYDADISEGIIMSGRQVEKSTTNSTKMATMTLQQSNFLGLYVAPLNEQVKEFSRQKIGKLYEYSQGDVVKKYYRDKFDVNNVHLRQFKKSNSTNYYRHCFELGDNIRGITVNGVWIDEIQDIHIDAIPVIKETQSHALEAGSRTRTMWYTGTPKTFNNTIQQTWERSTQHEWVITCPHCNEKQIMGVKNLEPHKFVCRKCKMELTKDCIANGFWIPLAPQKKIQGFRISQLMVPWTTPEDIWDKVKSYSQTKFFNEVLGRSYENAEKPFTMPMLMEMCKNEYQLMPQIMGEFATSKFFMGVDWGTGEKSYTVVTVYGFNRFGKFHLVFAKRFDRGEELDPDYQIRFISGLMGIYRVSLAVVDWGFGFTQGLKLQQTFGSRVVFCYYSFNQNVEKKYDLGKGRWVVNRTKVIQNYIDAVKRLEISWPGKNIQELDWLFKHHLAELAEYRKSQNGRSEELMFSHSESQPDDGLHSCVYAKLALDIFKECNPMNVQFTGINMPTGV